MHTVLKLEALKNPGHYSTQYRSIMKKTKKIRVALFTEVLKENVDGVTHTLYKMIERIPKEKFDFLFITPFPPSNKAKFPYPIVECRSMHLPQYKHYRLAIPYYDSKLQKALKRYRPDIIHFVSPSFLGHFALRYALANNIPVVSTYHTHFPMYVGYYLKHIPLVVGFANKIIVPWILRYFYNRCDLVYVPTRPVLEDLIELGIQPERLTIWARGVDMKIFNPGKRDIPMIEKMCGKNTLRILFVSNLNWIKEIRTIMGIYKKITKLYPGVKMIITGDGPQKAYMEKHMPGAVFTGKLLNTDLAKIYASSDIFLFPSITETFGNVVLEALASGLPVVAAARGGPLGIVREGETGLFARPKNVDDFCGKLRYLIDNPSVLRRMSKKASAYARTQSWDAICREMFASYVKIVSSSDKKAWGAR
jgi:glycosyltransferase involved in cell wall biosynthesis